MAQKKRNKKKLQKKLLHKYRLVVLNEDTFEERFAVKLTRLNVFFDVISSNNSCDPNNSFNCFHAIT
jgi:hypothetical protein